MGWFEMQSPDTHPSPLDLATAAARLQTLVQMYDAAVKDAEQLEEVRGG